MQDKSDARLLREYAEQRDDASFRAIVERHTDLVYSAALRQVGSPDTAADITQRIFMNLAEKAALVVRQAGPEASLAGWLYRCTRFTSLNHLRDHHRRTQRERQAMEQLLINSSASPDWNAVRPGLDEAMAELGDDDRDALLLRYFKNHDFRSVGLNLGISDDAAQKRVSRAVERLREIFSKRGVTIGSAGLIAAISSNAIHAAPASLAAAIGTSITTLTAMSATTVATTNIMSLKIVALITSTSILAGTGVHFMEQRNTSGLRAEHERLIAQVQSLTNERETVLASASARTDELDRSRKDTANLLRLRNEVATLRARTNEILVLGNQNRELREALSTIQTREKPQPPVRFSTHGICINNLRQLDGATQQWALETGKKASDVVDAEQVAEFIKDGFPKCPNGGTYTLNTVSNTPTCSIPGHALK